MVDKTFTVDYDDPSAIIKLISVLSSRRKKLLEQKGFVPANFGTSKMSFPYFMEALEAMIFSGVDLSQKGDCHVYVHCDPRKPISLQNLKGDVRNIFLASKFPSITHQPFYVGKGTGNRWANTTRNGHHSKIRQQLAKDDKKVLPVKIVDNLSSEMALRLESNIIDIMGIIGMTSNGLLSNLDEGISAFDRRRSYPNDDRIKKVLKLNGF